MAFDFWNTVGDNEMGPSYSFLFSTLFRVVPDTAETKQFQTSIL